MPRPVYRTRRERGDQPEHLIRTIAALARHCAVSHKTMWNWIQRQAFPAGKLPNGLWASSPRLIDLWLLARNPFLHPRETGTGRPPHETGAAGEKTR